MGSSIPELLIDDYNELIVFVNMDVLERLSCKSTVSVSLVANPKLALASL